MKTFLLIIFLILFALLFPSCKTGSPQEPAPVEYAYDTVPVGGGQPSETPDEPGFSFPENGRKPTVHVIQRDSDFIRLEKTEKNIRMQQKKIDSLLLEKR